MKILKIFILLALIFLIAGCSTQSKLIRNYKGKSQEEVFLKMGRPTHVETLDGGRKINIYEKSKFLRPAAINTGQFQYDRFESPKAVKIEVYRFFISSSGVVEDVKYELSYEH